MAQRKTRVDDQRETASVVTVFVLLMVLVGIVFFPALNGEFLHWDDDNYIFANPHLNGLGVSQIHWMFTGLGYMSRYMPLCWLSWASIQEISGLDPFDFHAVVLLFHALNAGLVFLVIRRLLILAGRNQERPEPVRFTVCAGLGAALWAVHPLRVETTAWAVELAFAQPLFFFLLSILSYLRTPAAEGETVHRQGYWMSLLLFVLSLASYPLAIGGLVVFLALDLFPLRRLSMEPRDWWTLSARRVWLEKVPFAAVTLFFALMSFRSRLHGVQLEKPPTLAEFGILPRVMQAFYIWAYYAWKPWVPTGLTPLRLDLLDFNPLSLPFLLSCLAVVGLTVWLITERRRWPGALCVWLCHLVLLIPVLGLSEHPHFPADRYSLVVNIGWAILLSRLILALWSEIWTRRVAIGGAGVLIITCALMSYQQTWVWHTNVAFFQRILAEFTDNPKLAERRSDIRLRLAQGYLEQGDVATAHDIAAREVTTWPNSPRAHLELGAALFAAGDLDDARTNFQETARLSPGAAVPWDALGEAYGKAGKLDDAVVVLRQSLDANPNDEAALQDLAMALSLQGNQTEAAGYLQKLSDIRAGKGQ